MTVWVVHPVKEDLSAALQYGDIQYINGRYVNADELQADGRLPQGFLDNMRRVAEEFKPHKDYLLIAGDHLQLIQMAATLTGIWGRGWHVLRYDRQAKGYYPVKMENIW